MFHESERIILNTRNSKNNLSSNRTSINTSTPTHIHAIFIVSSCFFKYPTYQYFWCKDIVPLLNNSLGILFFVEYISIFRFLDNYFRRLISKIIELSFANFLFLSWNETNLKTEKTSDIIVVIKVLKSIEFIEHRTNIVK